MNDLSVWNFAIDFTGRESAALIVAERPDLIESSVSQPVLERMRRCYELARGWHLAKIAPRWPLKVPHLWPVKLLHPDHRKLIC